MSYQVNFNQSNRADFTFYIAAESTIDGSEIDFTGAEVDFAIEDADGCRRITASIGDKITQPNATLLRVAIPRDDMKNLCPGTYLAGATFTINGHTEQLLVGNVTIYNGVVPR